MFLIRQNAKLQLNLTKYACRSLIDKHGIGNMTNLRYLHTAPACSFTKLYQLDWKTQIGTNRYYSTENDKELSQDKSKCIEKTNNNAIGVAETKLFLSFTCKVCNGHNSYTFSKQSYKYGVVIVTCSKCSSNHLIADNLGWFDDAQGKNIEEVLEAKGEKVKRFTNTSENNIREIMPKN